MQIVHRILLFTLICRFNCQIEAFASCGRGCKCTVKLEQHHVRVSRYCCMICFAAYLTTASTKHLHFLSFHFKNHLIKYPDKHNLILYRITPWNLSLAYQQKFVILAKKISNKTNILRKSRCIERKMSMSLFKLKGFDLHAFVSFSAKRACTYI